MCSSNKKNRICIIPRDIFFLVHGFITRLRVCAWTRRHVSSAILFPFPFIAALPSLFAEHQHHLLFARSIYSVNYICLCSRYTAVVLSSVNCAFTFFPSPPPPPPLYFYLFFSVCSFFVCSLIPRSLISLAIWYSARFAISHDIASRVQRAGGGRLALSNFPPRRSAWGGQ